MNEETINQIIDFLSQWGFWQVAVIASIVLLTTIIKIPLYIAGEKYEKKTGVDKSRITWIISLIPFILGFVGALILHLWPEHWDVNTVEWSSIVKQAGVLGTASMGSYEFVKKLGMGWSAKSLAAKVERAKAESDAKAESAEVGTVESKEIKIR